MVRTTILAASAAALFCATSEAAEISITVENLGSAGGFSFTPFWFGVHDGSFDTFNEGMASGMGVTSIAELGDTSVLSGMFAGAVPGGVDTTFLEPNGPPVFSPGESATTMLDVGDATSNRYLHYLSMVVPSNDLFLGNDGAIELFDAGGNFKGPLVIDVYGSSVWDNGSEVNDITDGAAFVQGVDGTLGTDEGGVVHRFFDRPDATSYFDSILGTITAPGDEITSTFGAGDLIGRITIVPSPAGLACFAVAGLVGRGRRRR